MAVQTGNTYISETIRDRIEISTAYVRCMGVYDGLLHHSLFTRFTVTASQDLDLCTAIMQRVSYVLFKSAYGYSLLTAPVLRIC